MKIAAQVSILVTTFLLGGFLLTSGDRGEYSLLMPLIFSGMLSSVIIIIHLTTQSPPTINRMDVSKKKECG